jgi:hypothetical protein
VLARLREPTWMNPKPTVAHAFHDGGEPFELRPPLPHRHERLVFRRRAEKRRVRMDFLEIPPDGQDLADPRAIVEDKGRHDATRVDHAIGRRVLLTFREIDSDERHGNALLSEEDPHASRIGRGRARNRA